MARSLLLVSALGIGLASPAWAADLGTVKCSPNSDRVWVYESLNSFDVESRLKCGETVEILGRVKGYVKIRAASGMEGYVPDAAFPELPALPPDDANKPIASVAAAARPAGNAAVRPVAGVAPAAAMPPAAAPTIAVAATSPTAGPPPVAASADVKPASATVATAAPPRTRAKNTMTTVVAEPPAPKKAPVKPAPVNTQSAKAAPSVSPKPASPPAAMVVEETAAAVPVKISMIDTSAKESTNADIVINEPARDPDLEEYPDAKPENESADPACRLFFSAYGLNPDQYKWLVENRRKQYSGICPAPDLSHVDYVILFAHDSDTYNAAMPEPVHTDRNGFSDFSPLTTVDTALISASELDKARYEFVWVFHTKRGTFDPTRFSARRRPQFTTDAKGSHAGARAVEDAFHFIAGQGGPDR